MALNLETVKALLLKLTLCLGDSKITVMCFFRLCQVTLLLLLSLLLLIAIKLSLSASSPYTSTDKTNNNEIYINETIQNTVNTSTHITKTPTHYKAHTHTHP